MPARRKSKPVRDAEPFLRSDEGNQAWVIPRCSSDARFRERWEAAVYCTDRNTDTNLSGFDHYWEYQEAVVELQRKWPALWWALQYAPRDLDGPHDFVESLWKEASVYATHLNEVVRINATFRLAVKAFADAEKAVKGAGARTRLEPLLREYADTLKEMGTELQATHREYWTKQYVNQGMRSVSEAVRLPKSILQDRNLDTLFQIRAGDLFRSFNPYLSLRTISRLVVLAYICGDIAKETQDNHLIVLGSDPPRELTVNSTYEKLRDAGLR